jgi:hypothetical protein
VIFFHKYSPFAFLPWHRVFISHLQPLWIPPKLQMTLACTVTALLLSRSWCLILILTTTRLLKYCSDFQRADTFISIPSEAVSVSAISLKESWPCILTRSSSFEILFFSLSLHSERILLSVHSLNSQTSFFLLNW